MYLKLSKFPQEHSYICSTCSILKGLFRSLALHLSFCFIALGLFFPNLISIKVALSSYPSIFTFSWKILTISSPKIAFSFIILLENSLIFIKSTSLPHVIIHYKQPLLKFCWYCRANNLIFLLYSGLKMSCSRGNRPKRWNTQNPACSLLLMLIFCLLW